MPWADQYLSGAGPNGLAAGSATPARRIIGGGTGPADGAVANGWSVGSPGRRDRAEGGLGHDDSSRFAVSATLVRHGRPPVRCVRRCWWRCGGMGFPIRF